MTFRKFHELRDDDPIFDNPAPPTLTTCSIAKLSAASARADAALAKINDQLAALRADLDAMKTERARSEELAARIAKWKAAQ